MEQMTAPPDCGRASTSATSDDTVAPGTPATIGTTPQSPSTIESSVAAGAFEAASAAALRMVPPVVPASTVASIGAGNLAASILGSREQMERMFASSAAAVALANVATPFAKIGRWHEDLLRPSWAYSIESMIGNSFSRIWEFQSGAPATQGEVVRRRLHRHRATLPYTTDPWADLGIVVPHGAPVGRLRPGVVVFDGTPGIYP